MSLEVPYWDTSVYMKVRGSGEMEHASMVFCSRGQLVKHRYTSRLMSVY